MSERLVNVDRETPMLLPADMREWVTEDDLVHFVISAAVRSVDGSLGTVEPTFGTIKAVLGLERVRIEWDLACLACNVTRKRRRTNGQESREAKRPVSPPTTRKTAAFSPTGFYRPPGCP